MAVLMILNEFSDICGGTKTALSFLYQFQLLGYSTMVFVKPQSFSQQKLLQSFEALKCKNQQCEILFSLPSSSFLFETVIYTYNLTFFDALLLNANKFIYFIQDYECEFYPPSSLHYYIAQNSYFWNAMIPVSIGYRYIPTKLNTSSMYSIPICADRSLYSPSLNTTPQNRILFVYYKNKQRRSPDLIEKIAHQLQIHFPQYSYVSFPDPLPEIPCAGYMNVDELSALYKTCDVAFCFSATNVSRLSIELASSGVIVFESQNENQLDPRFFIQCPPHCQDIMTIFSNFIQNPTEWIHRRIALLQDWSFDLSLEHDSYRTIIQSILHSPSTPKRHRVYIFVSNGFLGSDYLKGYLLRKYMNEKKWDIVCIPTDENFQFQSQLLQSFMEKIHNSIILFIRSCLVYTHPHLFQKLRQNNNILLYDHVDLCEDPSTRIQLQKITPFLDGFYCNNIAMQKSLQIQCPSFVVYHTWDPRLNLLSVPFRKPLQLGFLGCVKKLDTYFQLHSQIIPKYHVLLLDTECGQYINYATQFPQCEWTSVPVDLSSLHIEFNIHINLRDPLISLYKTNTKASTAAALGHLIITTKEPSIVELLGNDYPFYLEECTMKEFERVYHLLEHDYHHSQFLFHQARALLESLKHQTCIQHICQEQDMIWSRLLDSS